MPDATVTAHGEAVAAARPDEGVWTLEVSQLDRGADAALTAVAERARRLDALLDELGVAPQMRSTTGVSVQQEYDYVDGRQTLRGFRASDSVTVRLTDPVVAGRLIQGATAQAAAQVRGPSWVIAADNPARLEACRRAAEESRRKAEAYATALGLRLGPVVEIRDGQPGPVLAPRAAPMLAAAGLDTTVPVDPGELSVSAQVDVTFALEA